MRLPKLLENIKLEAIVFISGAVVMVMEIVGSRILAPYLGTSIFVWTSLIGVVLGSLALGYYFGGRLADKNPNYKTLGNVLFLAQIALIITVLLESSILPLMQNMNYDLRTTATFAGIIFFAPASILLGVISPYCVKLKLEDLKSSGETVGSLYALSTLGSILGTFLTGFVLFSYFRTTQILFFLIFILSALSILAYFKEKSLYVKLLVLLISVGLFLLGEVYNFENKEKGFIDTDTAYNRIWISDVLDSNNRMVRYMLIDKSSSSAVYLDTPGHESPFEYIKLYGAYKYYKPNPSTALLMGGAAYTFPRSFLAENPQASIDVVEIDPAQTELAKEYFFLTEDSRIKSIHEDARTYINRNVSVEDPKKYDVVFIDAFNSLYAVPFHLLTREFFVKVEASAQDDGVVVLNLISAIDGNQGKLFKAVYKTMKSVFPYVDVYSARNKSPNQPQNNIFIAYKNKVELPEEFKKSDVYKKAVDPKYFKLAEKNGLTLTDDFAPVESMVFEIIRGLK